MTLCPPPNSLFTEVADVTPVVLVHREPLTVPRADVDVDRAEVVVLLVACGVGATLLVI